MDDSLDFLLYSQDVMPNINPDDLQWHDYEKARALLQIVGGDKLIIPFC